MGKFLLWSCVVFCSITLHAWIYTLLEVDIGKGVKRNITEQHTLCKYCVDHKLYKAKLKPQIDKTQVYDMIILILSSYRSDAVKHRDMIRQSWGNSTNAVASTDITFVRTRSVHVSVCM